MRFPDTLNCQGIYDVQSVNGADPSKSVTFSTAGMTAGNNLTVSFTNAGFDGASLANGTVTSDKLVDDPFVTSLIFS